MDLSIDQSAAKIIPAVAPPPWHCRCETYWLFAWLRTPLSLDVYDLLEASHSPLSTSAAKAGLCIIQVVRYTETPVGPYDELLIVPGRFAVMGGSQKDKSRFRVARIYVSQRDTTYNGRRNWNIPKHLARFDFSDSPILQDAKPPEELTVSVYPPQATAEDLPFFKATFVPMRYLPSFPFSTDWSPLKMTLVQPPVPADDDPVLCGTNTWKAFNVNVKSKRARLMRAAVA